MSITTEDVERLTEWWPSGATALRSLAAERDALQTNLDAIVIPTTYYMAPPDGGDVSIAEQVRRMYRHVCDLQAENARLREALKKFSCNCVSNCEWEKSDICMSWIARAALGEAQ